MYLFLYKQKAAYEMRISDWSSDVCSSDLIGAALSRLCAAPLFRRRRDAARGGADLHLAARGGAAAHHQLRHLRRLPGLRRGQGHGAELRLPELRTACRDDGATLSREDRKSTRLNSSH